MAINWTGIFPATLCPFHPDFSIDEEGLVSYLSWLATHKRLSGLVTNGHTGEIMSLRPRERADVTRIAVKTVGAQMPVVSGVSADGSLEAVDHALEAKSVGAAGILLMPPHHWLRFGRSSQTAVGFVEDVAEGADISIVIHQYPSWTKAGYTLNEMLEMVKIPQVVSIKLGTRDMARQYHDYRALKRAAPHVSILTCHDEFLMASLIEGADGALVGFAGYAPSLILEMFDKVQQKDLEGAYEVRRSLEVLAQAIYQFGEPSSEAHQRMKVAAWLTGKLSSPVVRPPLRPLPEAAISSLRARLDEVGEKVRKQAGAIV